MDLKVEEESLLLTYRCERVEYFESCNDSGEMRAFSEAFIRIVVGGNFISISLH